MKITTEMTKSAYEFAIKIHEGHMEASEALDLLETDSGMNRASASDYIQVRAQNRSATLYGGKVLQWERAIVI